MSVIIGSPAPESAFVGVRVESTLLDVHSELMGESAYKRLVSSLDDRLFTLLDGGTGATIAQLADATTEDRMEVYWELMGLEEEGFVYRKRTGNHHVWFAAD